MAGEILLLDSFDRYTNSGLGSIQTVWSQGGQSVAGRFFGGKAGRFQSINNYGGRAYRYTKEFHAQAVMGAAVKLNVFDSPIFTMSRNGGQSNITLWIEPTGRMSVYRAVGGFFKPDVSTLIGIGSEVDVMQLITWNYVEFMCTFGIDGAQIIRAWVNGELVLEILDATTYNNSGVDSFGLAYKDQNQDYDDFYVRDGIDRWGEVKIETLNLNGDTSDADFSVLGGGAGYIALNDLIVDDDASYIMSDDPGARSLFNVSDLTEIPETIKAVQVRTYARKEDAGYRSLRSIIRTGGVEAQGRENVLSTAYTYHFDIMERSPNGNQIWTPDAVNNMQIGERMWA